MARDESPADAAASAEVARAATDRDALVGAEELPIVARLAIEIRSDGTRTVARGAMHDVASGQQVAIEIGSESVVQLARQLTAQVSGVVAGVLSRAIGRAISLRLPGGLFRRRAAPRP